MKKYTPVFLLIALTVAFIYAETIERRAAVTLSQQQSVTLTGTRVQTVPFESKMLGRILPYAVLLPVDYDKAPAQSKRYAVLYLLHGLFGHYDNWLTHTKLSEHAAKHSMIIIMPEGNDGWYTDSATVPADKYESYIVQELIPDVQRRFRTIEARDGRAIAGLSMGGYGALKFGVKYPETFVFAGSLSGALGAATWTKAELGPFESIWKTFAPVYGPENSPTRASNDLYKLFGRLKPAQVAVLPYLYLDCGTEDPLFSSSRTLSEILVSRKIPHEYRELPGTHSWAYWDAQVQEVLKIASLKVRSM
ncbi:MAG: alpha/beta hydrolase [Pyrinomonadaceae bacterium]